MTGYAKILLNEVMPQVQKSYHVSTNREERAIAGLSMGGAETLYTGLNNLDKFAWLGSFSGAFVMWPRVRNTAARLPAAPAAPAARQPPPAATGCHPGAAPAATPVPRAAPRGRQPARAEVDAGGRGGGAPLDASVFERNFPALDAKANSRIKYMVIACGTADGLIGVNRQFKAWLKTKNVQFTEEEGRSSATCGRCGGRNLLPTSFRKRSSHNRRRPSQDLLSGVDQSRRRFRMRRRGPSSCQVILTARR